MICALCGSERNVEVGHIDGKEENGRPENLIWTCRVCNVRCGLTLRTAGLGRITRQFNPQNAGANSLGQWLTAVMSMKGLTDQMSVTDAVAMIHATPPEARSDFAKQIWTLRKKRFGSSGRGDSPPF